MFPETLLQLDRAVFLLFNGSDSLFLDRLATLLTSGFAWMPFYVALLYLVIKNNDTMPQIALTIVCALSCILLADALADGIVKPLVARPRPLNDPFFKDSVDSVTSVWSASYSFFSAHAANTFSLAVFFSFLIRHRLAVIALMVWSAVNCWTRLYLGVHYPGDILVGLLWGGIVGVAVWFLFTKLEKKAETPMNFISNHYTKTGYQHEHVEIPVCVMAFTLIYAIVKSCLSLYIY